MQSSVGCIGVLLLGLVLMSAQLAASPLQCADEKDSLAPRLALLDMDVSLRGNPALANQPSWTLTRIETLMSLGQFAAAEQLIGQLDNAAAYRTGASAVRLHNASGRVHANSARWPQAAEAFGRALDIAEATGSTRLQAQILLNQFRAAVEGKRLLEWQRLADATGVRIAQLQNSAVRDQLELSYAELLIRSVRELAADTAWLAIAEKRLQRIAQDSAEASDIGYAQGYLAHVEEIRQRFGAARKLTVQALQQAEQADSLAQTFRWHWQLGRILLALDEPAAARVSLAKAVFLLENHGPQVIPRRADAFRAVVAPVYRSYTDLLLASDQPDEEALKQVQSLFASLQQAEVEDYFSNECIARSSAVADSLPAATAILQPLIFADRVEMLVETSRGVHRVSTAITRRNFIGLVREFRLNIEQPVRGDSYLQQSRRLYDIMLGPLREYLENENIQSLLVIPDGALRTIPFAALHDGGGFLIEDYAVVTAPAYGLSALADAPVSGRMLTGGLTQAVQGFSQLPAVAAELELIAQRFPTRQLINRDFRVSAISQGLVSEEFNFVHLATHGEFNANHLDSFLLTYDGRLTFAQLQTLMDGRAGKPIDLLVLSACQTAAGDDRAALGLAGIAVQSGARSAIASLWSISDESTAALFQVFYQQLGQAADKAQSLRHAQIALLSEPRYQHPSYWAPYLLIGNAQ